MRKKAEKKWIMFLKEKLSKKEKLFVTMNEVFKLWIIEDCKKENSSPSKVFNK